MAFMLKDIFSIRSLFNMTFYNCLKAQLYKLDSYMLNGSFHFAMTVSSI